MKVEVNALGMRILRGVGGSGDRLLPPGQRGNWKVRRLRTDGGGIGESVVPAGAAVLPNGIPGWRAESHVRGLTAAPYRVATFLTAVSTSALAADTVPVPDRSRI